MAFPIMTSPTAFHIQLNREAEAGTYKGSQAASNTPYIVSHNHSLPIDKIAAAATSPLWFQLYPQEGYGCNQGVGRRRCRAPGARPS